MPKVAPWLTIISLISFPVEAQPAQLDNWDSHTGGFVGARFHMSLGGRSNSKPRASLAIAPTLSKSSAYGEVRTSIGEGFAVKFSPKAKPTLTLAGTRADRALGLQGQGGIDSSKKQGISSGGWVAIGVGVVALAGGIFFLNLVDEAEDNSD